MDIATCPNHTTHSLWLRECAKRLCRNLRISSSVNNQKTETVPSKCVNDRVDAHDSVSLLQFVVNSSIYLVPEVFLLNMCLC